MTHVNKMYEASLDGESETNRAIRRERKKCSICFFSSCNDEERCPANTRSCNCCWELGYFRRSTRWKGVMKIKEEGPLKHEMVAWVIREGYD